MKCWPWIISGLLTPAVIACTDNRPSEAIWSFTSSSLDLEDSSFAASDSRGSINPGQRWECWQDQDCADPLPLGCTRWTCQKGICQPDCPGRCNWSAGDCQGELPQGCHWTCADQLCLPDCRADRCQTGSDCQLNPPPCPEGFWECIDNQCQAICHPQCREAFQCGSETSHLFPCTGRWSCAHGQCGAQCESNSCGDGYCAVKEGEDPKSCPLDCHDFSPTWADTKQIFQDIRLLSSKDFEGRQTASAGNRRAESWVADRFAQLGLQPGGDEGGFLQNFEYQNIVYDFTSVVLHERTLQSGLDYTMLAYDNIGSMEGPLVFAGYGITVPAFSPGDYPDCPLDAGGYDDLAGLDLAGKIVIAMMGVPGDDDRVAHCPPPSGEWFAATDYWQGYFKAFNISERGAAGIILIQPFTTTDGSFVYDYMFSQNPAFQGASVRRELLVELIRELPAWAEKIDYALRPFSQPTDFRAQLAALGGVASVRSANVLGFIPGTDPNISSEVVVVGAHLDSIGIDPRTRKVYLGADDNASGVAVILELARLLKQSGLTPARTVLFAAFNAEEIGLIGSCSYVYDPLFPLEKTRAMFSVDMVGSGSGTGLIFYGGSDPTNAWLVDLATREASQQDLPYVVAPFDPLPASDHACFAEAGVPAVLALSLGDHSFYHTAGDSSDTINLQDLKSSTDLLWLTLRSLAMGQENEAPTAREKKLPFISQTITEHNRIAKQMLLWQQIQSTRQQRIAATR